MINEILPHQFDNRFRNNNIINAQDYIFLFNSDTLLLKVNGDEFELPRRKDLPEISNETEKTFLFALNDIPCFVIWDDIEVKRPSFVYKEIGVFRTLTNKEIAWVILAGYHLRNWYTQNRFCGNCGSKTQQKINERALVCTKCEATVYPKISPAVIVAITSNNKILLARNTNFTSGWYSLIAGYTDIGETLEETVVREVKEEVGLDVKNIRYYKSQPWPLSGSMMVGFVAEANEEQPIRIDEKEIAEAAWFTRGNLPQHSSIISIAGEMIEKFENGTL